LYYAFGGYLKVDIALNHISSQSLKTQFWTMGSALGDDARWEFWMSAETFALMAKELVSD
jgi:hypothetical protein